MSLVSDDVMRCIRQLRAIEDRLLHGKINPVALRPTLQGIIERKSTPRRAKTPSWYVSVGAQIEKVSAFLELHGGQDGFRSSDIPPVPDWDPRTVTEVLMLTVMLPDEGEVKGFRRTFDSWWSFMTPLTEGVDSRREEIMSDFVNLRLAQDEHKPGIRWVAFDPRAFQGESPSQVRGRHLGDGTTLANAEVIMAVALFPEWKRSWFGGMSAQPNMSGYQLYFKSSWSSVPGIAFWHEYVVEVRDDNIGLAYCSSPTVREC